MNYFKRVKLLRLVRGIITFITAGVSTRMPAAVTMGSRGAIAVEVSARGKRMVLRDDEIQHLKVWMRTHIPAYGDLVERWEKYAEDARRHGRITKILRVEIAGELYTLLKVAKLLKGVEEFLYTANDSVCTRWRDPRTAKCTWALATEHASTGRTVWAMMHPVMQIVDDSQFAEGEHYCLQVARSDDPRARQVRRHKEPQDISHQYLCAVENFSGATLRQHSECSRKHYNMDTHFRFVRMDGRIDHEVVYNTFKGVRFGMVFYNSYDPKITMPTPKLLRPM
eukprot:gene5062-6163_t